MCGHRDRAVQQEVDRPNQQRYKLLARVQDILDQAQTQNEEVDKLPVSTCATVSGYTLVTDSPVLGLQTNDRPPTLCSETPNLCGYNVVEEEKVESEEEDEDEEDMSLDSLLKKSREYVKREQSQQGSKVVHTVTGPARSDTVSDKENKSCSPTRDTGVEFGFSLHHSPMGAPQTQIQHQILCEPSLQQSGRLSPSLPDRYVRLPSPESSISPCARRRRPRPVSTGNIHISFPIGPADLIPRSPGRSGEGASMADWGKALAGATKSADHCGSRRSSHCDASPVYEACSPIVASMSSPMGHHDDPAAGFRRRCHTLDSQPHTYPSGVEHIGRCQERIPRFMAGVSWLASSRRTPAAPLNQTYELQNPSPSLLRPHLTPDLSQVSLRMEPDDSQGPSNGRIPPTVLRHAPETLASMTGESHSHCFYWNLLVSLPLRSQSLSLWRFARTLFYSCIPLCTSTEETQRRAQALEDMQRRLEEEHALQMSLLLAEQEKEQQRLRMELEVTEKRLKEQECVRPLSGDGYGWNRRHVSDSSPAVNFSCPGLSPAHTPSEQSPGHSKGFPSQGSSRVCTPSVQPPVYLWGPTWAASKPRARLSLILTAEQQTAFCRIGAITRGFLIRRLLKTEKVKHLRQTIMDTQEFIRSFQTEAPQKKSSLSAQDISLQERVRAQLRAALYDIHDIFFEMPLGDRLALLQQERELRAERKLRDLEKTKCPKERVVLSAATQRSLDRKKRVAESPAQARKMQQKPKSPITNRCQHSCGSLFHISLTLCSVFTIYFFFLSQSAEAKSVPKFSCPRSAEPSGVSSSFYIFHHA
uniref:Centriolar coiled-coil protein of 110 kDa n=1 Tax=Scophthalmus maximus TaxID=52904 RepID=A0A8D3AZG9_SCOMX